MSLYDPWREFRKYSRVFAFLREGSERGEGRAEEVLGEFGWGYGLFVGGREGQWFGTRIFTRLETEDGAAIALIVMVDDVETQRNSARSYEHMEE